MLSVLLLLCCRSHPVFYIKQLLFYSVKDLSRIMYRSASLELQKTSQLLVVCTQQWRSDFFKELFKEKAAL